MRNARVRHFSAFEFYYEFFFRIVREDTSTTTATRNTDPVFPTPAGANQILFTNTCLARGTRTGLLYNTLFLPKMSNFPLPGGLRGQGETRGPRLPFVSYRAGNVYHGYLPPINHRLVLSHWPETPRRSLSARLRPGVAPDRPLLERTDPTAEPLQTQRTRPLAGGHPLQDSPCARSTPGPPGDPPDVSGLCRPKTTLRPKRRFETLENLFCTVSSTTIIL